MKKHLVFFILFLALFSFIFRSLLAHFSTHLLDTRDYPYVVWVMYQSIDKIVHLNFSHFFETNAFYPHPYSLLYSDILLPQAIIATPFSLFISNPILVFNMTFVVTFILNYIASLLFWKTLFKKDHLAFLGAVFTVFSPYFQLQLSHFQLLTIWPFFFSLFFLFRTQDKKNTRDLIISGVFLAVQFLASVYLAVFLLFGIILFFILSALYRRKPLGELKKAVLLIGVFVVIDAVFIKAYLDMKQYYHIVRDIREYINYSAHLSDYLFTTHRDSFFYRLQIFSKWNGFDKHFTGGLFPGFLFSALALIGVITFHRIKKNWFTSFEVSKSNVYFLLLGIAGFLFSLGPRISFNGQYAHLPAPYWIFIKFVPLFDAVRATARWYFLLYIAFIFFSLKALDGIKRYRAVLPVLFLVIFLIEYVPLGVRAEEEKYMNNEYLVLKEQCVQGRKVLLEVPVQHFDVTGGIVEGLSYITQVEFSSVYHRCYLINGYSGYDPSYLFDLKDSIYAYMSKRDTSGMLKFLRTKGVQMLKINENAFLKENRLLWEGIKPEFEQKTKKLKGTQTIYVINSL